ncbi:SCO1860 family LAETG-anchored protein [Streptantibioticus parmotrematis]|uniref:SCO1860 family LAETG-anchored protein n=1 Tax=Streptantibioticus parmotrematis TaxID=2873249 RepID=UPI0033DDC3E9
MPTRRSAAAIGAAVALAATTLTLAPGALAATPDHHGGANGGRATAVVLRAGLDVALLGRTVDVPLNVSLDDVQAPADVARTALSARLGGVNGGNPFDVLRADVATSRATADAHQAEGYVNLVNAKVSLPGLLPPLATVHAATARATCVAGRHPQASTDFVGTVDVLGKPVRVTVGGPVDVRVAGVGEVRLSLSQKQTTSRTAAATALDLKVDIDPLKLGIAHITGDVTLVQATCETPNGGGGSSSGGASGGNSAGASGGSSSGSSNGGASGGGSSSGASAGTSGGSTSGSGSSGSTGSSGGSTSGASGGSGSTAGSGSSGGSGTHTQTVSAAGQNQNLAETGADSDLPYLAGGAGALVVAGGLGVLVARRRKSPTEG